MEWDLDGQWDESGMSGVVSVTFSITVMRYATCIRFFSTLPLRRNSMGTAWTI